MKILAQQYLQSYKPLKTSKAATPSFGTNNRRYTNAIGDEIGCNTWLFRDDINWEKLAKFELKHFKDKPKVNIVQFACSDGSESYTKIMSLMEQATETSAKKFLPIRAYDIDEEILNAAKSGILNTCMLDRIELQIHTENYEDYFTRVPLFLNIKNDIELQSKKVLKAKKILTDNVRFEKADMYKKIKEINDNSDTVLMCRNILGYFENDKIENFVNLVAKQLKKDSIFVIGEHDVKNSNIKDLLNSKGFQEVMTNVYKRA